MGFKQFYKLALLGALVLPCFAQANCPLIGPDFPAPQNLSSSGTFQAAITDLVHLINIATSTSNTSYGPYYDGLNTSVSLEFFSIHETAPLITHHFTAPKLAAAQYGVKSVNSSTIYRLGSITKLFSVYTFLASAGDLKFNEPVTKYVPELLEAAKVMNATENSLDHVSWEDVTLGDLASQMADIGRDYAGLGEIAGLFYPVSHPYALGLPPLNASEQVICAGGGACTRAQFFSGFTKRHPVYAPGTAPVYSNAAYQILAYALENITGTDFPTLVQRELFDPLDLTESSWTLPSSNSSAIIPDGSSWSLDLGDETPAGGMYSSTTDLTKLARSILASTLISPAQTRRWLKPRSFTSNILTAVGAPWEIRRLQTAPDSRLVDLYAKDGDLPGYSALLVVIPDWDVGFSILTAGDNANGNVALLANMIGDSLFPAIEAVAREEANATYAGFYAAADTSLNSSITITTDASKPGLDVTSWTSNGTDMLSSPFMGPSIRLYPTGLKRELAGGETEMGFRAVYEDPTATTIGGTFGNICQTWVGVDQQYWGTVANDEFVITVGYDGKAKSVQPRMLKIDLVRTEVIY
jgi:CubicO group peptidase (beta-lactamase class C family)